MPVANPTVPAAPKALPAAPPRAFIPPAAPAPARLPSLRPSISVPSIFSTAPNIAFTKGLVIPSIRGFAINAAIRAGTPVNPLIRTPLRLLTLKLLISDVLALLLAAENASADFAPFAIFELNSIEAIFIALKGALSCFETTLNLPPSLSVIEDNALFFIIF